METAETKYFDYSICSICKGKCCTTLAGSYIPEDFEQPITTEFILSLLNTGKFAIDWWIGDVMNISLEDTYYVRPRHKKEGAIVGSWGGICVNWSFENGCSLSEEERPYQCKKLIPKNVGGNGCDYKKEDKANKFDCAVKWYPYQSILSEAMNIYQNKNN